jgi:hypothetical protein
MTFIISQNVSQVIPIVMVMFPDAALLLSCEVLLTKQGVRLGGCACGITHIACIWGVQTNRNQSATCLYTQENRSFPLLVRGYVAGAISGADTARRRQLAIRALSQVLLQRGIGDKRRKRRYG